MSGDNKASGPIDAALEKLQVYASALLKLSEDIDVRLVKFQEKIDIFTGMPDKFATLIHEFEKHFERVTSRQESSDERIIPVLDNLVEEQAKLRGLLLSKIDGLQGSMDMLRQDVRNSWGTADFAISNSRNVRDDTDKLLDLISTMQKQHQLLASQVEVLRRNAEEKGT